MLGRPDILALGLLEPQMLRRAPDLSRLVGLVKEPQLLLLVFLEHGLKAEKDGLHFDRHAHISIPSSAENGQILGS